MRKPRRPVSTRARGKVAAPVEPPAEAVAPVEPPVEVVPPAEVPVEVVPPVEVPVEVAAPAEPSVEVVPPVEVPVEVVPPAEVPVEVVPPVEVPVEVAAPAEPLAEVVPPAEATREAEGTAGLAAPVEVPRPGTGPVGARPTMPAWRVSAPGDPGKAMILGESDVPEPGPGQVLVEVAAAALHFADLLMVQGRGQERPPLPFTPGIEACGTVTALGPGVRPGLLGERVCTVAVTGHGTLARYALVPADLAFPAPPSLDDAAAATLLVSYQTAWFALHRRAALRVGETLLVHAAAGGVGRAAVQFGRSVGARVIAVVGNAAKAEAARAAGADLVIDRTEQDVVTAVREATRGRGADVVFDPVGGAAFEASTKVIAFEGRIVVIGFTGGRIPAAAADHLLVKTYGVLGLNWGRYVRSDPELIARVFAEIDDLVAARVLCPLVADRLPFEAAADGLTRVGEGESVGRLVVLPPGA